VRVRQHPGLRYYIRTFTCTAVSMRGRPLSIGGGVNMSPVRWALRNLLSIGTLIPVYSQIFKSRSPRRDMDRAISLSSLGMCRPTIEE